MAGGRLLSADQPRLRQIGLKPSESSLTRSCRRQQVPAWQITRLSPTQGAPNYCNPRESARPPSSSPSGSLQIALIETQNKEKGKK